MRSPSCVGHHFELVKAMPTPLMPTPPTSVGWTLAPSPSFSYLALPHLEVRPAELHENSTLTLNDKAPSFRACTLKLSIFLSPLALPHLVVRPTAAHVDLGLAVEQRLLVEIDGADDALEGLGHVGEVGDAAADDERL